MIYDIDLKKNLFDIFYYMHIIIMYLFNLFIYYNLFIMYLFFVYDSINFNFFDYNVN